MECNHARELQQHDPFALPCLFLPVPCQILPSCNTCNCSEFQKKKKKKKIKLLLTSISILRKLCYRSSTWRKQIHNRNQDTPANQQNINNTSQSTNNNKNKTKRNDSLPLTSTTFVITHSDASKGSTSEQEFPGGQQYRWHYPRWQLLLFNHPGTWLIECAWVCVCVRVGMCVILLFSVFISALFFTH